MCSFIVNLLILASFIEMVWNVVEGEMRVQPPQTFRVTPKDVRVKEGDDVTLTCEIDYLAGQIQWTKDGMALGIVQDYDEELWGYPRYKYTGNKQRGVCNLHIRNVSLDDDAEYQCQVGQKLLPNGVVVPLIRAGANLTVILPPSSIEIVNYANNSRADVREHEDLTLTCLLHHSRQPIEMFWYRGKEEIKADHGVKYIDCKTLNKGRGVSVCKAMSSINLRPRLVDDGQEYSCVTKDDTLPEELILSTRIYFQVLYAPGPPYIDGYREGDPSDMKTEGQVLELTCRSNGGNPLAQLRWFRNGVELSKEILYSLQGKVSENRLRIELKASDNDANYTCEASNAATREPLRVTTRLSVAYGPDSIELSEVADATAGQSISVTCTTSSSHPPAEIQWVVEEQSVSNDTFERTPGENGGAITASTVSVVVPFNRKEMLVSCYASNPKFSKYLHAKRTVNIYYPPGTPIIRGYSKTGIGADTKHELSCTSSGGNPLAELTWYKNDRKILAVSKSNDKTSSFADIVVLASKSDNGAEYRCEASNPTLAIPLVTSIKLQVYFAPDNASVTIEPSELREGASARLFCFSSSSNPPAEITWWRNNRFQITDGISTSRSESDSFGGQQSNSELLLNVTSDMHRDTFTCRATNIELQKSINFVTRPLEVLYKPIFKKQNYSSVFSVPENNDFSVTLEADANPPSIAYYWRRGENTVPRAVIRGPTLLLHDLRRSDSGSYQCEARNTIGSDYLLFQLDVTYEASITSITKTVMVKNGTDAEMACTVSGNPLEREDVLWTNQEVRDFNHRAVTSFEENTLTLKLSKATVDDMGRFYCVVNNRIGVEKNASTLLIVEHAPVAQRRKEVVKVASDNNLQARFVCDGSGAPRVDFTWYKNGSQINRTVKYSIENEKIDELNYKSTLLIKQITSSDYDHYYCVMKNKLGSARLAYKLIRNSKPDPPSGINVVNVTRNAVSIVWTLPFDGGEHTFFRIRYSAEDKPTEKYSMDVDNDTNVTISGLRPGVLYTFELQSRNVHGGSDYSTIKVNTTAVSTMSGGRLVEPPAVIEGTILLMAAIGGVVLLLMNLLIIFFCAWRRSKKDEKSISDPSNKSLEMYTTASKNGTTDASSGTLSSMHSLKLNHEENEGQLNFIIEDINYPFVEKNDPDLTLGTESKYKLSNDAYSSMGHLHLIPPPVPQLDFCYDTSSVIGHPTRNLTLPGRRRMSQDYSYASTAVNCLPNGSSPTPSIPPPMSAISTHAYSSLQCMHNNYLHV